jgi:hypothetical protein
VHDAGGSIKDRIALAIVDDAEDSLAVKVVVTPDAPATSSVDRANPSAIPRTLSGTRTALRQ